MPSPQRKRLDSWKAVAEYLGRNVRTVTRWAEQRHLPVHRVPGGKRQSVFAYSDEIDAWLLDQRSTSTSELGSAAAAKPNEHGQSLPTKSSRKPANGIGKFAWMAVAVAALIGGTAWVSKTVLEDHARGAVPLRFVQLTNDGRSKNHFRTDGRMLYFDEAEGVGLAAFSAPISGGRPQQISINVPNPMIQDVSRDGQKLLVTSSKGIELEHQLWVVPSTGGVAQRVSNITCETARWSPDDRRIACVNGTSILIANADGTHARTLVSLASTPFHLAWTPDEKGLIFALGNFNDASVTSAWEISANAGADGTPPTPHAFPWGKDCCVDWTWADGGKWFLFLRYGANSDAILEQMPNLSGSPSPGEGEAELPVNVGRIVSFRTSEQKGLVYLLIEGPSRGEVLRVGSTKTAFQVILPGLSANDISYSQDGRWMAYVNPSDQTLWRSRSDGTDALQLTRAPTEAQLSSWSPDGHTIAYMRRALGGPWRIFLVDRSGTRRRVAVPGGEDNQGAPSWSPDGKMIVYGNVLCQQTGACWINKLDVKTGKLSRLPGSHGLRTARFSPDGRYIAALQPEKHEILLFDVKKRIWKTLVGSMMGDNINWSSDSRFIFADSPRVTRPVIEKIRISDGYRTTVADLAPLERMPGDGSPWFGLAPDGSPILVHLYNSSEIYALNWNFH